ncbi:RING finger and SPRY domain-containing protein 1, partial [Podila humilis]
MAARLLERVFVKVHIRAAWSKLYNMTEHGELSSALESLIHLTATDSSYCELIGVMVDMISTDCLGVAAPFLCHIIDMAALPSQQTTRRMSRQLLSKCDPGGLARLRSRKKNKTAAALIWSVLANRLAGEMSSTLFSDAVCDCLLNNVENDPDMLCKVFSIIALEKFSLTGPCKARILKTNLRSLLRDTANMSTYGLTDQEEIAGITQAKFCAEWSLRNIFRDPCEEPPHDLINTAERTVHVDSGSPSIFHAENDISVRDSISGHAGSKRIASGKSSNINVMVNTLDATRHWKVSEDGLSIRNDGSTFESIRATKSVTCGKWFYEVLLVTAGIMQLGWATTHCQFSPEEGTGIGDDIHGFSFDGCRNLIWAEGESEPYGNEDSWKPGDILGFYLDIDNAILECFLNGKSLGSVSPFSKEQFDIQASSGYFPAFSFTSFQQATVNFGATPFKYPPALPWRNLNDHGSISPEMRKAIIRPRSDSVYGKILLDPVTGLRLPTMQEEEDHEMDYSSLCTICCDHASTVTLQPCGHSGLCVECAYSLDICPLCRSRIYQRQLLASGEVKDENSNNKEPVVAGGLCIIGLSSDSSSSADASVPGLSHSSSTSTSAWSAEYYGGNSGVLGREFSHNLVGEQATAGDYLHDTSLQHQQQHQQQQVPESRLGNHTSMASSPSARLALDCLEDPFSPPSTAYFAFLNRPARQARGHMHPLDMDSVDPLEMTPTAMSASSRPPRFSPPPPPRHQSSSSSSIDHSEMGGPLSPDLLIPTPEALMLAGLRRSSLGGSGPLSHAEMPLADESSRPANLSGDVRGYSSSDENDDDDDEQDVVLVEEGREASDSEVMEQSAPDFPEGHSFHSRRSSVQFTQPLPQRPLSSSSAIAGTMMMMPLPESESFGTAGSLGSVTSSIASNMSNGTTGTVANNGTSRFGARRASMP